MGPFMNEGCTCSPQLFHCLLHSEAQGAAQKRSLTFGPLI
jgi:hypothetical protein